MVSKNTLLGSGVKEEVVKKETVKIDEKLGWVKRLYHPDCLTGKVFETLPEQDKAKEIGWVESPADINKTSLFSGFKEKKSKIDVSVKKVKSKAKGKK